MRSAPDPLALLADQLDPRPSLYVNDPVGFITDGLGERPYSAQKAICELVRDHKYIAVRSCHGVGKSWIARCGECNRNKETSNDPAEPWICACNARVRVSTLLCGLSKAPNDGRCSVETT